MSLASSLENMASPFVMISVAYFTKGLKLEGGALWALRIFFMVVQLLNLAAVLSIKRKIREENNQTKIIIKKPKSIFQPT